MSNEVATASAPAVLIPPKGVFGLAGGRFRVIKQVTRTVLRQIEDTPFYVTFESAAAQSNIQTAAKGAGVQMAPARVCDVINLETGELQILIMNRVLESELERETGGAVEAGKDPETGEPVFTGMKGGYVGRSYAIVQTMVQREGKKKDYKGYRIYEIAPDVPPAEQEGVAHDGAPVDKKGKRG